MDFLDLLDEKKKTTRAALAPAATTPGLMGGITPYARKALDSESEMVATAPNGTRNDTLNRAAFSLGQLVGGGLLPAELVQLELKRAARAAGLPDGEIIATLGSGLGSGQQQPRTAPAAAAGPKPAPTAVVDWILPELRTTGPDDDPTRTLNDDLRGAGESRQQVHSGQVRMAHRLAKAYADKLIHVHAVGWMHWDGRCWREDRAGHTIRAVVDVLRRSLAESLDQPDLRQDVRKCETANGITGVLKIAAALPGLAATADQLDADPYLLNVANGTLDLRTMELHPHNPANRMTHIAAAAWDPAANGPTWSSFLGRVLPDEDTRSFLQRYAGLALAGKVLEHRLAILTGRGRNGKGVFYQALNNALGDYAGTAEPDLFMHREGAHPTGEMDLRGRRLVTVSESEKDRRLAEATMKRLTGGDTIRARRLYQDFTEFAPSHTVLFITNHLPKVSGDDPAIWARIRVVPFSIVIPSTEQDPHLPEKLQLEMDAILAWAVAGWQDYQANGLAEPASVVAATANYHRDADALGRFIDEECDTGPGYSALIESLHQAWTRWAAGEGLQPMSKRAFGAALEQRGHEARKGTGGVRVRSGIQLKPAIGPGLGGTSDRQEWR